MADIIFLRRIVHDETPSSRRANPIEEKEDPDR
jgi:hypothetical protein